MRHGLAVVLGALLGGMLTAGCQNGTGPARDRSLVEIGPGVSRDLADYRRSRISDLRYALSFAIPAERAEPVRGRVTASFTVSESGPVVKKSTRMEWVLAHERSVPGVFCLSPAAV